jgi:hypothetical protein
LLETGPPIDCEGMLGFFASLRMTRFGNNLTYRSF